MRGVGLAVLLLLLAGCAAATPVAGNAHDTLPTTVIVPRAVSRYCVLPTAERCHRIEALLRWEHAHGHEQELAHLGTTIVDTYDAPPLTIVFESGTLTSAVKRYVEANLPPEVSSVPIEYIQGPISFSV